MSSPYEELTRDNFETVYEVYHGTKYGFGGNTSIWVAVEEETEDRIVGRECDPIYDWPRGRRIVIQKDNVAGWAEDVSVYKTIPAEVPDTTT